MIGLSGIKGCVRLQVRLNRWQIFWSRAGLMTCANESQCGKVSSKRNLHGLTLCYQDLMVIGGLRKEVKRMNVNLWFAPNKAFDGRGHFGTSRRSHRFSWKPLREHTSSPQRGSRERELRLAVCPGSMSGGVQFVVQPFSSVWRAE